MQQDLDRCFGQNRAVYSDNKLDRGVASGQGSGKGVVGCSPCAPLLASSAAVSRPMPLQQRSQHVGPEPQIM